MSITILSKKTLKTPMTIYFYKALANASASGLVVLAMASVIRYTWKISVNRAPLYSARIVIHVLQDVWACLLSALVGWKLLWRWQANLFTSKCQKFSA